MTIAHHALKAGKRGALLLFLGLTVALGCLFLYYQATEYAHAYHSLNLTLGSGIYGSTFFKNDALTAQLAPVAASGSSHAAP